MKYLASLASLAAVQAAQPLSAFLKEQFDNVVTPYSDGFTVNLEPYFHAQVSNYGRSGTITHSLGGVVKDVDKWEVKTIQDGGKVTLSGTTHGNNMLAIGFEVFKEIEHVDYKIVLSASASAAGVSFDMSKDLDFNLNNGRAGTVDEKGSLKIDYTNTGNAAMIEFQINADRRNSNLDPLSSYTYAYYFIKPYTIDMRSEVSVNNLQKCSMKNGVNGLKGCNVEFEATSNINGMATNWASSMSFKPYAIVLKIKVGDDKHMVFVRQTDQKKTPVPLNLKTNFIEMHYARDEVNWQRSLKRNTALLVLRVPTYDALIEYAMPKVLTKAKPFLDFSEAVMKEHQRNPNEMTRIPYILYYVDEIFEDMNENQFNCDEIVKATGVESELVAEKFEVESINDEMQSLCQNANDHILNALQGDEVADAMEDIRDYVERMSSDKGHNEFKNLFKGHIV